MLRVRYKNPLTRQYQYEFCIFDLMCRRFKSIECNSRCIDTLELYYAELVGNTETGNPSFKRQEDVEAECEDMIDRDVIKKLTMGNTLQNNAKVSVSLQRDGGHVFRFFCDNGVNFAFRFKQENGKKKILCKNI